MQLITQVLLNARALVYEPVNWKKGYSTFARYNLYDAICGAVDKEGVPKTIKEPVLGMISKFVANAISERDNAQQLLDSQDATDLDYKGWIIAFNDYIGTEHKDVINLLDDMIKKDETAVKALDPKKRTNITKKNK